MKGVEGGWRGLKGGGGVLRGVEGVEGGWRGIEGAGGVRVRKKQGPGNPGGRGRGGFPESIA